MDENEDLKILIESLLSAVCCLLSVEQRRTWQMYFSRNPLDFKHKMIAPPKNPFRIPDQQAMKSNRRKKKSTEARNEKRNINND
jgi:hypothetical protein